jgi:uncharacterized cupredoxin-like copper-binding protein
VKLLKADAWFPDTRDVEGTHISALGACAPGRTPVALARRRGTRRRPAGRSPLRSGPGTRVFASCLVIAALFALWIAPSALAADSAAPARIDVTMHDFKIKLSRRSVPAGRVDIHVHNRGPSTHEINVDRTNLDADSLPIKGDGLTVNEDSKSLLRIDSIEQLNLGDSGDLHLDLRPGHYVLYCNLEGHYLGGMHASFDVRPDGK